jgi:anti-sigma factor RsiW
MHCKDVREQIDELWAGEVAAEIRLHLASCPACAEYLRDMRLVRTGFRLLTVDPAPEPSLGFAARLVRRLSESSEKEAREAFFEYVGRRFVYATLALVMFLVLALVVPSTGPVRAAATADLLMAEQEQATVRPDPVGSYWQESSTSAPADIPQPADQEQKGQK